MQAVKIADCQTLDARQILEAGDILAVPSSPFAPGEQDRAFLRSMRQSDGSFHKNIAYRPAQDKLSGFGKLEPQAIDRLRSILRDYSRQAIKFTAELLPAYKNGWRVDYTSLRLMEEYGRDLPFKKRNDLLHVDAFPTRPTNGDLILRVFTNIHSAKSRVWITSDPFAMLAPQHAWKAGLQRLAKRLSPVRLVTGGIQRALGGVGVAWGKRSPYDAFMLGFHDYLKANAEYQKNCPKYRFEFPPGSSWLVFTDLVPHSVESGQFALEQTLIVSRHALASRERAPIAILERIAGARLSLD